MSFNMRDYVSNEHIESIGEIAKSQSAIIQALSLDNSQKDREIERLNNIINEITILIKHDYFKARELKEKIQRSELCHRDYPIAYYHADWLEDITDVYLNKLQELKGDNKE